MSDAVPWSSNISLREIAAGLRTQKRVAVLTHAKADGDAVGSVMAVVRTLRTLGVEAKGVFPAPWFARFEPFVGETPAVRLPEGDAASAALKADAIVGGADRVLIVDTGSWAQVGDARAWLEPLSERAIVVDHHPSGNGEIASKRLIRTDAAAACEIVAELCCLLLGVDHASALPKDIAEPLFLGLATDTGWFRYSNTRPGTLRMAAELIEAGVDHSRVLAISEQSDKPARLRIVAKAMESLELLSNDRVAIISISNADLQSAGADLDDAGGLTDLPQTVATVRAVAVLTEAEPGLTKVSLRSKPPLPGVPGAEKLVDVNAVAKKFGGGGHVHAAGAKIRAPLADAKRRIGAALVEALA